MTRIYMVPNETVVHLMLSYTYSQMRLFSPPYLRQGEGYPLDREFAGIRLKETDYL
jgi:hypothetical protein